MASRGEPSRLRRGAALAPLVLVVLVAAAYLSGVNYWKVTGGRQVSTQQQRQQQPGGLHRRGLQDGGGAADVWWDPAAGKKLEWLHIPKTGTSFGNSLVQLACPELEPALRVRGGGENHGMNLTADCALRFRVEPGGWIGEHLSLTNRSDEELGAVFALLRSPATRAASGFHYIHRTRPMYRERYNSHHKRAGAAEVCAFVNATPLAHAARGAQVKIVAGEPMSRAAFNAFASADPPAPALVAEACRRLRLFAFVGISDFWNATVCLFHGMWGGEPHAAEFANVRPGRYQKEERTVKAVDCGDEADGQLYQCAMELFVERIERYSPQCKEQLGGGALEWLRPQRAGAAGTA